MIDAVLSVEQRRVILVDGFNVLHAVLLAEDRNSGWWRRELRERLLRRVCGWPEGDDEIWVAFDGALPSWSVWAEPVAKVHRARPPIPSHPHDSQNPKNPEDHRHSKGAIIHSLYVESADDWIVRRARRTPHPERTIVVSADRQVAGRARSAGCEVWTPWAFMSRCPSEKHHDGGDVAGLAGDTPRAGETPT